MRTRKILCFILVILFVNVISIFSPTGFSQDPRVHNVDTGLDFETIQEAINANTTLNGHTILVEEGVYFEHVTINKSISLLGENKSGTIIDGEGLGKVVKVRAANVSITGFTVQNSGLTSNDCGIFLNRTKNSSVNDNIIRNSYFGIFLYYSDNNNVSSNTVVNNTVNGMLLSYSYQNVVSSNIVFNNSYVGINLFPAGRNILESNNIYSNVNQGIYIDSSKNNAIRNNNIWKNRVGIELAACFNNVVIDNDVSNNTQSGLRLLGGSTDNSAIGNTFLNNNQFGISLSGSSNNTIIQNNFVDNATPVSNTTLINSFDNGLEGNYWSEYTGKDDDNDGIGDTPFLIPVNSTDNYPLMGMFSGLTVFLEEREYRVSTICNFTVTGLHYNNTVQMMQFQIQGVNGSSGFCRVMIPNILMVTPHLVFVDGEEAETTLLPVSNITHSFIFFNFNGSHQIRIVSKPYYDLMTLYNYLLDAYNSLQADYLLLQTNYNELNASYTELTTNYTTLIATFAELQDNYTLLLSNYDMLQSNYDALDVVYNELNMSYTELTTNYTTLIATFAELQDNYSSLENDLEALQEQYVALNGTLTDLALQYEVALEELDEVKTARRILEISTFVGAASSVFLLFFGIRYYRMFGRQRKMLEVYKRSPLEVGRLLFELDVKRRKTKIERFEKQYGVKIQPRSTLEDLFKSLREKKEEEDS